MRWPCVYRLRVDDHRDWGRLRSQADTIQHADGLSLSASIRLGHVMTVSAGTKNILAMRSGNRCALPDCGQALAFDSDDGSPLTVGEAAHIAGRRPGSARHDPEMNDRERDAVANLVYVCRNCHRRIDQDVESYSVERLHGIKASHEAKVKAAMDAAFATVGFAELQELVEHFSSTPPTAIDSSLVLLPPDAKIKKNDLGPDSQHIITMGLAISSTIRTFVSQIESDDPDWSARLKNGFVTEYLRLRKEGHRGDELFELMSAYSTRGFDRATTQCAAISVLVYMFEACEVFER